MCALWVSSFKLSEAKSTLRFVIFRLFSILFRPDKNFGYNLGNLECLNKMNAYFVRKMEDESFIILNMKNVCLSCKMYPCVRFRQNLTRSYKITIPV